MKRIEEQLNSLPKFKLGRTTDLGLRMKFLAMDIRKGFGGLFTLMTNRRFRMAISTSAVVLVVVVSVPVYAYASEAVSEGHLLYTIKKGVENIELALKTSDEGKAKTYAKFSERRLEEAAYLAQVSEENEEQVKTIIEEALVNGRKSQEALIRIENIEVQEKTKEDIQEKKQAQQKKLEEIAQKFGLDEDEATIDAVALALEEVKLPPGQVKKNYRFNSRFPVAHEKRASTTISTTTRERERQYEERVDGLEESDNEEISDINDYRSEAKNAIQRSSQRADELLELKNEYDEEEVDSLIQKINKKIESAEEDLAKGNLKEAEGELEATEAWTNNAKHFLKPNKKNKGRVRGVEKFEDEEEAVKFEQSDINKNNESRGREAGNGNSKNKK